jgi:hypothetical protein
MTEEDASRSFEETLSRWQLGTRAGPAHSGLVLAGSLAGPARARPDGGDTLEIGFVSPRTDPAAGFGEPDLQARSARSSSRTRTRQLPL